MPVLIALIRAPGYQVIEAFEAVDRAHFLTEEMRPRAYVDAPIRDVRRIPPTAPERAR